jgi:energy-coupling factor transporter ATP-binding protein EcfA2
MAYWQLESVEINGGFLAGLSLRFPPSLTCIIGPRGSGKSTLAEALRFVFGSSSALKTARDLVQANLGESVITAKTSAGAVGTPYVVRRSFRQQPVLSTSDGKLVSGVELERGTFLPLDVFSSNEIEAIAEATEGDTRRSLLDDLRSEELSKIQFLLSDHRRALAANRDAIRAQQAELAGLVEESEELADAPIRLAAMRSTVLQSEVNDEFIQMSRQRQSNEREMQAIVAIASLLRVRHDELLHIQLCCNDTLSAPPEPSTTSLQQAHSSASSALEIVRTASETAVFAIDAALATIAAILTSLRIEHSAVDEAFAELQQRNVAASNLARERAAVERAVARHEEVQQKIADTEKSLSSLFAARSRLKALFLLERENISRVREEVAAELQREAGSKVRVRVLKNADSLAYQQVLTAGLQGARVRNHDDILAALMRLRPEDLAQFMQDPNSAEFETHTGLGAERARKILDAFKDKLDPLELEVLAIDDRISIELNVASAAEPIFKDAAELSRGQKCTALLPLLLARRTTPLVIDQPEDNLDNHFIYETVVENVRRLKRRRQMIFVTHNANIPVLAEADLVVVLDSDGRAGFVRKFGTLDDCQDDIIDLLEGGREAFELRRRRYER